MDHNGAPSKSRTNMRDGSLQQREKTEHSKGRTKWTARHHQLPARFISIIQQSNSSTLFRPLSTFHYMIACLFAIIIELACCNAIVPRKEPEIHATGLSFFPDFLRSIGTPLGIPLKYDGLYSNESIDTSRWWRL